MSCQSLISAVPEAEDLDIGEDNDLAADVDDGDEAASDPEGLDSSDDEELGDLDMIDEESEGETAAAELFQSRLNTDRASTNARSPVVLAPTE